MIKWTLFILIQFFILSTIFCQFEKGGILLGASINLNRLSEKFPNNSNIDDSNYTKTFSELGQSISAGYLINKKSYIGFTFSYNHVLNKIENQKTLLNSIFTGEQQLSINNEKQSEKIFIIGIDYGRFYLVKNNLYLATNAFLGYEYSIFKSNYLSIIDNLYNIDNYEIINVQKQRSSQISAILSSSLYYQLNQWLGINLKFATFGLGKRIWGANSQVQNHPNFFSDISFRFHPKYWEYGLIFYLNKRKSTDKGN